MLKPCLGPGETLSIEEGRKLLSRQGGQPEAKIKRQIRDYLEYKGWRVYRIQQSALSQPGLPDLFCFKDGLVVFVEVKTPTGRLSDHQKNFQTACEEEGVRYVVARGAEDCEGL